MSNQHNERQSEATSTRYVSSVTTALAVAGVGLLVLLLSGAGAGAHAVAMAIGQSLLTAGAIGVVLHLGQGRD